MKKIEVVAAVVVNDDKILCVQRGESKLSYISKKYEFPGGKVEVGESLENALIREIKEELKMNVSVEKLFLTVNHTYPDFNIIMHSFLCNVESRELELTEHLDARWLAVNELDSLDWAGADIPIVEKLKR